MPTDEEICERVCRAASALGYRVDDLGNSISGQSFTFVAPDGTRIAGGINPDRKVALIHACKKLLPQVINNF